MVTFSEEHIILRDTMKKFVDKEYPPNVAREIDENDRYPRDVIKELAKLGLTGVTIDKEYGGEGRDIISACIVTEELARRSIALAWVYVESVFFGGENISKLGNEEQQRKFLPKLAKGDILFCYALTEPNAGSDLSSIQTFAVRDNNEFVINGNKMFISGARECEYMLLLARTDKTLKNKGLSFFIVDLKTPGITARPVPKIGVHGSDTCDVALEDVRVPIDNLLGGPNCLNRGWQQLLSTLDIEHLHMAVGAVGMAQGAFYEILSYVKNRVQFGQPISKFQAIQHNIADLATEIQASRLITYYVASLSQEGKPCLEESAMAKLYATEVAKKVSLAGVQLHGGYGCSMEYDIQRYARDSLIMTIGGGTSEIQRNLIAKSLGL
jgi:alkylation response protein AidB-like acyl-CoA dehydrogenase